jgi:CyaY protein
MDDLEFQRLVDQELQKLHRALIEAGNEYDFEADFNAGALTVEFEEPPGKFVVSPNGPVKQIWVSAHVKSFKLDWNEAAQAFVLPSGQTLKELMADCIEKQLGQPVEL